jgi:hypothetical protein
MTALVANSSSLRRTSGLNVPYSKTLAGMLLTAVLAALMVVADQLIDTWADGNLLASWVAMWVVVFVALAWLLQPLSRLARTAVLSYLRWSRGVTEQQDLWSGWVRDAQQRRVEGDLWDSAQR